MKKPDSFVVAIGNPFDGISLVGPFDDAEEANEWAENHARANDWWSMHVRDPATWDGGDDNERV